MNNLQYRMGNQVGGRGGAKWLKWCERRSTVLKGLLGNEGGKMEEEWIAVKRKGLQ